jgi:hypothetical protein
MVILSETALAVVVVVLVKLAQPLLVLLAVRVEMALPQALPALL